MVYTFQGFTITYDGRSVVRVTKKCDDVPTFAAGVMRAYDIVHHFPRSKPGTDWGCDGVGYAIQQRKGEVEVMRSGVGPRKFREGFKALTGTVPA